MNGIPPTIATASPLKLKGARRCSIKKSICIILAVLLIIPLSGCADYKNIGDMDIVTGVAVDKKDGKYLLRCEIIKHAGGSKEGGVKPLVVETCGYTLSDAIDRTMEKVGGQVYFEQCKVLIIGEQTAGDGELRTFAECLLGSREFHVSGTVLIRKGGPAGEVFDQKPRNDTLVSIEIARVMENQKSLTYRAADTNIADINNALDAQHGAVMLPVISIDEEDGEKQNRVGGAALLDRKRLAGFLDDDETGYLLFAANQVRGGTLIKQSETGKNICEGAKVLSNKTVLIPEITGGKISMTIRTDTQISLTEPVPEENFAKSASDISGIEKEFALQLSENIKAAVIKAQIEYGCDVLGFRHELIKKYPGQTYELNRNWPEKFKEIDVRVDSKVNIKDVR